MILSKLAFAHRTMWRRDATYRFAFVLGPPVLAGSLLGVGLWLILPETGPRAQAAPWAHPEPNGNLPRNGAPVAIAPLAPLPHPRPDGSYAALERGWAGAIHPVTVGADLEVNVLPNAGAPYLLPPGPIELSRIIASGQATGLFVGIQSTLVPVRMAGRYGLTLQLQRSSYDPADCLMRLGLGPHRLLSNYEIGVVGEAQVTLPLIAVDLQPGLYHALVAFGCWHDGQMAGPGQVSLLIRQPGEERAAPARDDELYRPVRRPQ